MALTASLRSIAVLLALISLVSGQTLADLPACSVHCLVSAVTSETCGVTDYACQCTRLEPIRAKLNPCLQSSCSEQDTAKVNAIFLEGLCKTDSSTSSGNTGKAGAPSDDVSSPVFSILPTDETGLTTPAPALESSKSEKKAMKGEIIVAIVVGCVAVGLLALGGVALFVRRRRKQRRDGGAAHMDGIAGRPALKPPKITVHQEKPFNPRPQTRPTRPPQPPVYDTYHETIPDVQPPAYTPRWI